MEAEDRGISKGKCAGLMLVSILVTAAVMLLLIYMPAVTPPTTSDEFTPTAVINVTDTHDYVDCMIYVTVQEPMILYVTDSTGNVVSTLDVEKGGWHTSYDIKESCTIHVLIPDIDGIKTKLEKIE